MEVWLARNYGPSHHELHFRWRRTQGENGCVDKQISGVVVVVVWCVVVAVAVMMLVKAKCAPPLNFHSTIALGNINSPLQPLFVFPLIVGISGTAAHDTGENQRLVGEKIAAKEAKIGSVSCRPMERRGGERESRREGVTAPLNSCAARTMKTA